MREIINIKVKLMKGEKSSELVKEIRSNCLRRSVKFINIQPNRPGKCKTLIINIKNYVGDITTDPTDIKNM